jgi:predicted dithiol-disulfide oxidoreductase (DUF899 family)
MTLNRIVGRDEWLDARRALLAREKAHTRQGDLIAQKRRELPWVLVDQDYRFEGPDGGLSFGDLFDGRNQLIVQHFMFGPGWDEGCDGCSLLADHVEDAMQHLGNDDVAFVAVSRAAYAELAPFKARMGWNFTWVSSYGSTFNSDFGASITNEDLASGRELTHNYRPHQFDSETEIHGLSVFYRHGDGTIFHTYSTFARGVEQLANAINLLDIAPLGRNEQYTMDWVRLHDTYA